MPLLADPELRPITINDFSPGLVAGADGSSIYPPSAPLGSASLAYRCYNRPGVGLRPFPTYSIVTFTSQVMGASGGWYYVNSIATAAQGLLQQGNTPTNFVVYTISYVDPSVPQTQFEFVSYEEFNASTSVIYNHTANIGNSQIYVPQLTRGYWTNNSTSGLWTFDPHTGDIIWVPNSGTYASQNIVTPGTHSIYTAFTSERFVYFQTAPIATFQGGGGAFSPVFYSGIQDFTSAFTSALFLPELASKIHSWGSISTGEFLVIFEGGGAVMITGDIGAPTSAITLPGVRGTGLARGAAIPTPIGLVYPTDSDGVWAWNGGNVAQKISTQLPDNAFLRPISTMGGPGGWTLGDPSVNNQGDLWNNWIMFPNNYFFDTQSNSWWQCEDPTVTLFSVHAQSVSTGRYFYSSDSTATFLAPSSTGYAKILRWDELTPASSYRWISNPISDPGARVTLGGVEIVASNPTATAATVTVTPTPPGTGTTGYPNQVSGAQAKFTIPAHTMGYRGFERLGYNDYNVCVKVDAANSNGSNEAPTIHEITVGITERSSSAT